MLLLRVIFNNLLSIGLCGFSVLFSMPIVAEGHMEELVQSFQNPQNQKRTKSLEVDHTGKPLYKLNLRVPFFGSPVHENMTIHSINLSGVHDRKYVVEYDEPYIHGVFWSDDPEDLLCPGCSAFNFLSSKSKCNTTGPNGLRCCHAKTMLHTLEC